MQLTKQKHRSHKRAYVSQCSRSGHRMRSSGNSIRGTYCTKKRSQHIATRCHGGDTLPLPTINKKQLRNLSIVKSRIKILSNNSFETYIVDNCEITLTELRQICDICHISYNKSATAFELALKIKLAYNRATQKESYLIWILLTAIICGICGTFIAHLLWLLMLVLLPFTLIPILLTGPFGLLLLFVLCCSSESDKSDPKLADPKLVYSMLTHVGIPSALTGVAIYLLYIFFKKKSKLKAAKKIIAQIKAHLKNERKPSNATHRRKTLEKNAWRSERIRVAQDTPITIPFPCVWRATEVCGRIRLCLCVAPLTKTVCA